MSRPAIEKADPPTPEGVTLTVEQFERYKQSERERDALRAAEDARTAEAAKAEEARLLEQGKLKEVIAKKDEEHSKLHGKLRETEARFKATTRDRELAVELGKHSLTEGSSEQLMDLWREKLVTVEEGEGWKVETHDGKPVAQFVRESLGLKTYAKFVARPVSAVAPSTTPDGAPEPTTQETRQIDSLRKSAQRATYNPLAGVNSRIPRIVPRLS